jgi:hypothetical protein
MVRKARCLLRPIAMRGGGLGSIENGKSPSLKRHPKKESGHRSIINGCDMGSKNHPGRFIRHHL